jgi:gamma-glutamylcysteine synthetase
METTTTAPTIPWDFSSPWDNPHFSTLYSQEITLQLDDEYKDVLDFFVSDQGDYCNGADYRLIVHITTYRQSEKQYTRFYDLGSFPDSLDNSVAVKNVQTYANYVLTTYQETFNLAHCPSFELIDNVDENFNPL